jgi:hypothetical protein
MKGGGSNRSLLAQRISGMIHSSPIVTLLPQWGGGTDRCRVGSPTSEGDARPSPEGECRPERSTVPSAPGKDPEGGPRCDASRVREHGGPPLSNVFLNQKRGNISRIQSLIVFDMLFSQRTDELYIL